MSVPFEDIKQALENDHPEEAVKKTKKLLKNVEVLPLAIAITGESGSGKSSLVNTLRGVDHPDPGAAPTGVVETTMEPTEYKHPQFPTVTVWDLPGVGTMKMQTDKYVQKMDFQKYDFFIIVSSTRFRENDAKLALEIQKMNKKFYFVRSKIDSDVYNAKRSQKTDETQTLKTIRDNCIQELDNLGVKSPKVFLLSSFERLKYDFTKLVETLQSEMSQHQRESLLRAVPSYSLEVIQKKKAVLEGKIPGFVTASVLGALVIIPGVSAAVDIALMRHFAQDCVMTFGINDQTLELLSKESEVPLTELKAVMKVPPSSDPGTIVAQCLTPFATGSGLLLTAAAASGPAAAVVAAVGAPVLMAISGATMGPKLHQILDTIAGDAQHVLEKAIGL